MLFLTSQIALFGITRSRSHFTSRLHGRVDLRLDMSTVTPDSIDDVSSLASTDLEAFLRNDSVEPQPSSSKHTAASTHEAHQHTEKTEKEKEKEKADPQKTFSKDYQVCKKSERRPTPSRHLRRLHQKLSDEAA